MSLRDRSRVRPSSRLSRLFAASLLAGVPAVGAATVLTEPRPAVAVTPGHGSVGSRMLVPATASGVSPDAMPVALERPLAATVAGPASLGGMSIGGVTSGSGRIGPADRDLDFADRPIPILPALAGLAALIVGIVQRRRR